MSETNYYCGYSLFTDIERIALQTYNRLTTVINIAKVHGEGLANSYLNHFSREEQMYIDVLQVQINEEGEDNVRRQLSQSL